MTSTPKVISSFEADLVTIARYLMHQPVPGEPRAIIQQRFPKPQVLSENAIHLVRDSLSKGCILFLIRNGGWRNDRFLKSDQVMTNRVWERHPLVDRALHFGRTPLDFLLWMTSDSPQKPEEHWRPHSRSPADDLFFALALSRLSANPEWSMLLRDRVVFADNGLARLVGPEVFAAASDFPKPDFAIWFQPPRVMMLEALQPWITSRWLNMEFEKNQCTNWNQLGQIGQSQSITLTAYLEAARTANRPDLARFLLTVSSRIFANGPRPLEFWFGGLESTGPSRLAERLAIRRNALAVPRALAILEQWARDFRSVGYFDEEYARAQAWKAEWEHFDGDRIADFARQAVLSVEPLQS